MAKLITLLEQQRDEQPPTVAIQATTWWETVLAHVKLQECGLEVNLHVHVCSGNLSRETCYIKAVHSDSHIQSFHLSGHGLILLWLDK